MLSQQIVVYTGAVIKSLNPPVGYEAAEIVVSGFVFGEQYQVVSAAVILFFLVITAATRYIYLTTKYRFEYLLFRQFNFLTDRFFFFIRNAV